MQFNCTQCGLCCKKVGLAVMDARKAASEDPMTQELANFPYSFAPSGRCSQLTEDNQCAVYDHRPAICNVSHIYEKYFNDIVSRKQFYRLNEQVCEHLKDEEIKKQ